MTNETILDPLNHGLPLRTQMTNLAEELQRHTDAAKGESDLEIGWSTVVYDFMRSKALLLRANDAIGDLLEALSGLVESASKEADDLKSISGYHGARLSDARDAIRRVSEAQGLLSPSIEKEDR